MIQQKGFIPLWGFKVFGKDKRAIKLDNAYLDEDLMVLFL